MLRPSTACGSYPSMRAPALLMKVHRPCRSMTKMPSPVEANSKSNWLRQAEGAGAEGRGGSMFMPAMASNAYAKLHMTR